MAGPVRGEVERLSDSVGFIGLGNLGAALALRIVDAGFPLTIWARREEALAPFAATSARVAGSPRELATHTDIIGLCVRNDADVREVVHGENGVLAGAGPGSIVAIHSTVHPETCRRLADEAGRRGIAVIDAPVSGAREGAERGDLLVMTGGDRAAAERCRPVFETFGRVILHMGPIGSAQRAKVVNNTLLTANLALASDALALGEELGIKPETLAPALLHGSARSFALETLIRLRALPELPEAGLRLLRKDVDLLRDNLCRADAPVELIQLAERFLRSVEGGAL